MKGSHLSPLPGQRLHPVRLEEDPGDAGSIGCTCGFGVTVENRTVKGTPGDWAAFNALEIAGYAGEITMIVLEDAATGERTTIGPPLAVSAIGPGVYSTSVAGTLAKSASDAVYNTSETSTVGPALATLTIKDRESAWLIGSVSGNVVIAGPPPDYEERLGGFSAEFEIFIPPDYVPPISGPTGTTYRCTID